MPDTPAAQAETLTTRLEKRLASLNIVDRNELTLTVRASLGTATYPDTGQTVHEILQLADAAMLAQKDLHKSDPPLEESDGQMPIPPVFRRVAAS